MGSILIHTTDGTAVYIERLSPNPCLLTRRYLARTSLCFELSSVDPSVVYWQLKAPMGRTQLREMYLHQQYCVYVPV